MNTWQEKLESIAEFKHLGSYIHECQFLAPFLEGIKFSM